MTLMVIAALCGLSLLAAFVLSKLLQSTASISKPEYQLGGAAAGFVVILVVLSYTYIRVNDHQYTNDLKNEQKQTDELQVKGQDGEACQKAT